MATKKKFDPSMMRSWRDAFDDLVVARVLDDGSPTSAHKMARLALQLCSQCGQLAAARSLGTAVPAAKKAGGRA